MLGSKKNVFAGKVATPWTRQDAASTVRKPRKRKMSRGTFLKWPGDQWLARWWFEIYYIHIYICIYIYIHVLSSSLFGEDYHFDSYIFGMGWNHHLAAYSEKEKKIEANLTKKDSADSYFCMCQKWGRGLSRTFCKKKHATSCSTWQSLSPSWAPSTNLLIYPCVSSLTMKNNVGLVWFGLC